MSACKPVLRELKHICFFEDRFVNAELLRFLKPSSTGVGNTDSNTGHSSPTAL
jgi:hypothetical protein